MTEFFIRAYPPAQISAGLVYWLPSRDGKDFVVVKSENTLDLLQGEFGELNAQLNPTSTPLYLGNLNGVPLVTSRISPDFELAPDWEAHGMYQLFGTMEEKTFAVVGYAHQMLGWERNSRFCPACAGPTNFVTNDWGKRCVDPACGLVRYPPVSPAVLILIHSGDYILLGRKPGWGKRYSILAGFVEPGETFEGCVRREAIEESGLRIASQPVYKGSQPWPFPHQVMVGYTIEHPSTEEPTNFDTTELEDVRWFRFDEMPPVPAPLSLSGQLIKAWVESRQTANAS